MRDIQDDIELRTFVQRYDTTKEKSLCRLARAKKATYLTSSTKLLRPVETPVESAQPLDYGSELVLDGSQMSIHDRL